MEERLIKVEAKPDGFVSDIGEIKTASRALASSLPNSLIRDDLSEIMVTTDAKISGPIHAVRWSGLLSADSLSPLSSISL